MNNTDLRILLMTQEEIWFKVKVVVLLNVNVGFMRNVNLLVLNGLSYFSDILEDDVS